MLRVHYIVRRPDVLYGEYWVVLRELQGARRVAGYFTEYYGKSYVYGTVLCQADNTTPFSREVGRDRHLTLVDSHWDAYELQEL